MTAPSPLARRTLFGLLPLVLIAGAVPARRDEIGPPPPVAPPIRGTRRVSATVTHERVGARTRRLERPWIYTTEVEIGSGDIVGAHRRMETRWPRN